MTAWLHWSATSWHWLIYILAAAAIAAVTGGVLYYRDPPAEAALFEHDLDAAFSPPPVSLPGPVTPMRRAGELHLLEDHHERYVDPRLLSPDWYEVQARRNRERYARQVYIQAKWRAASLALIAEYA
jgi:hypothetical protein